MCPRKALTRFGPHDNHFGQLFGLPCSNFFSLQDKGDRIAQPRLKRPAASFFDQKAAGGLCIMPVRRRRNRFGTLGRLSSMLGFFIQQTGIIFTSRVHTYASLRSCGCRCPDRGLGKLLGNDGQFTKLSDHQLDYLADQVLLVAGHIQIPATKFAKKAAAAQHPVMLLDFSSFLNTQFSTPAVFRLRVSG